MNPSSFFSPFYFLLFYAWIWNLFIFTFDSLHTVSFYSKGLSFLTFKLTNHLTHDTAEKIKEPLHFKKGWYGIQIQEGPILYAHTPVPLLPFKHCFRNSLRLYEGDLITFLSWSETQCDVRITSLPAFLRLSLKLPLNLNQALAEDLVLIKGLGLKKAHQIIRNRPYRSLKHLLFLKGVGSKTLKKWSPFLTLDSPKDLGPFKQSDLVNTEG